MKCALCEREPETLRWSPDGAVCTECAEALEEERRIQEARRERSASASVALRIAKMLGR